MFSLRSQHRTLASNKNVTKSKILLKYCNKVLYLYIFLRSFTISQFLNIESIIT